MKHPLKSKTLWVNLLLAVLALVAPGVSTWLQANPTVLALIFTAVNMGLRFITKEPLTLK